MSQAKEKPERVEEIPFCWGVKKGCISFYESFTLEGVEYSLFDTVYLWNSGLDEPSIGKIVKILETENHEKKVEVVWFFRPSEIRNYLGDVRLLDREIFLACGEGEGLSKAIQLEAICGKCNVVCSSRDKRNPHPTEKELRVADNVFHRSFDVKTCKISEEFPSSIAGIEVGYFFNRSSATSSVVSEAKAQSKARSEVEPVRAIKIVQSAGVEKSDFSFDVPGTSSGGHMKSSIKEQPRAGGNMKKSVHFLSESPSDTGPTKKRKILPSSGIGTITKQHLGPSISYKFSEVTRRPGMDSSKWLKLEVWSEGRLNEANERGTLVVLENLDPSFTSSEVEDIIWHVFKESVRAKMVPCTAFSSPHSGRAIVIFKTKDAADTAIAKLISGCLVLGDGRLIVGRRRLPKRFGVAGRFAGHLTIDRTRYHRQREEIRNAVSTSHFSQPNTVEFEMALHWQALQEKSDIWCAALHEEQGKEIEALMKQMKNHCPE